MKTSETKYYDDALDNVPLNHNCGFFVGLVPYVGSIPWFFNIWRNISPGPLRDQRIGDKISPVGISIKLWIGNKQDRPNTMHRVIVAVLPRQYNGVVTTTNFDPFQNMATGNRMLLPADTDKGVKFLYDRIIRMPPNQEKSNLDKEITCFKKLWIKSKKGSTITYNQALQQIVNRPLALYVIPYEQYNTSQESVVASVSGMARLYYKDV
ncbi:MAG: hypothetical protein H7836_17110 [Magnetococcus sp. YQC-3]